MIYYSLELSRVWLMLLLTVSTQWVVGYCIIVDRHGREIRKWVSATSDSKRNALVGNAC